MSGASGLCNNILFARYGHSIVTSLRGGRSARSRSMSYWCKGVSLIGSKKENPHNSLEIEFVKKVGSGLQTSFLERPLDREYTPQD